MGAIDRSIRILIVDDHPVLRDGIAAIIGGQNDMALVGEAGNGAEAIEQFRNLRPDVTLMDLQMPRMNGVEAIAAIRKEFSHARIVVLTTYAGDAQAMRALKAGAVGYLLKSTLRKDLLDAIRSIHAGRRHIPPDIAQEIAFHAADEALSEREVIVLTLAGQGKANKEIAWQMKISEDTVKAHMRSIFAKLDANDRTQAVTLALRRGIIDF
ncbi:MULTISPECIES: response regulator transcription factor [Sphingomonas]|uniref:response regulator transcription factor n=1 Tax=Sphingomonas TaxID=13687 RepID=UPI001AE3383F